MYRIGDSKVMGMSKLRRDPSGSMYPIEIHSNFQTETLGLVLVLLMGLFHGRGGTG